MSGDHTLLILDAGNSRVKMVYWQGEELELLGNVPTSDVERFFEVLNPALEDKKIDFLVLVSVVPEVTKILTDALSSTGISFFKISHEVDLPYRLEYETPETIGADRLCNVAGALSLYQPPLIVLDLGTAINFDVVDRDGTFIGGIIMPGPAVQVQALVQNARQIPEIPLSFPATCLGRNTLTNIQSGIMYGTCGAINWLTNRIVQELAYEPTEVIATGGFAQHLIPHLEYVNHMIPELTILGALKIFQYNQSHREK